MLSSFNLKDQTPRIPVAAPNNVAAAFKSAVRNNQPGMALEYLLYLLEDVHAAVNKLEERVSALEPKEAVESADDAAPSRRTRAKKEENVDSQD